MFATWMTRCSLIIREIDKLLPEFNSYHPEIQFTIEKEVSTIFFLVLTVIRFSNKCITNWYTKPSCAGILLNFHSNTSKKTKCAVNISLLDSALNLSNPAFYPSSLMKVFSFLLRNEYPLSYVSRVINILEN